MHDILVALVSALFGGMPWLSKLLLRLLRGEAERQQETSELGRMGARVTDLEDLIDLLRKALDKHLIREAAIASAAEFVIAIVKMVQRPTPEMLHLRNRAVQLLADARAHISNINEGSRPQ